VIFRLLNRKIDEQLLKSWKPLARNSRIREQSSITASAFLSGMGLAILNETYPQEENKDGS